jgi:ABC-type nitrate/sulfonate/bicarbonate transport system substrate-binding protein
MTDSAFLHELQAPVARRDFLSSGAKGLGAIGLLGGLGGVLAGCGSSSSSSSPAASTKKSAGLYDASLQLCYLENVQFAGSYFASTKGYYKDAGVNVTLIPGGPSLAPEPIVVAGKALVGVTHTSEVIPAINNGAPLKVIGATYQVSPTCILSKASDPITKPTDMYGMKIGISDSNAPTWAAFVKANHLDLSKITVVTVDFSVSTLETGEIQGIMAFAANEPTELKLKGIAPTVMLLSDFSYPLIDDVYIATESALADATQRKAIVGIMTGESRGWRDVIADPDEAAVLAVDKFGKGAGFSLPQQKLEAQLQNPFVHDSYTAAHGLLSLDPTKVASTIKSLALGGVKASPAMFTSEVLDEVYKNGPTLS